MGVFLSEYPKDWMNFQSSWRTGLVLLSKLFDGGSRYPSRLESGSGVGFTDG